MGLLMQWDPASALAPAQDMTGKEMGDEEETRREVLFLGQYSH